MVPSSLAISIPNSIMTPSMASVGLTMLVMALLSWVPAWLALMPLLAISPTARAVSSMEYPREPQTGATYLNVSPIISTLVFALLEAAAITSARRPASAAVYPIAVRASVTISDVVARSAPDAAARFMIPLIPFSISSVFHPAIAM